MVTVQPWKISGFTARSAQSPRPFPFMGKGAALEDISPAAPGGVAQPGQAVKGKPPRAAVLRTLDCQLPAVLSSRRRRGIYHQSPYEKMRGDNDCFGTFCLEFAARHLGFRVEWPGSAGGRLVNQNRAAPSGLRPYRAKKPSHFQGRLSA